VILRTGDRMGQAIEAELLQPLREFLQMLTAEMGVDEAARSFRIALRDESQHQTRHQCVIEFADGLVAGSRRRDVLAHDGGTTDTLRMTMGSTGAAPGIGP